MSAVRILPAESFKTSEWSGGTTTELFLWPEDGSYAERRFGVRISSALVELPESDFTPLPGVKRFLAPLSRGFLLDINGEKKELPVGEVLEFSGDDKVHCTGSGRDLNLMLKGAWGDMRPVSGDFCAFEGERTFVFAPSELTLSFCSARGCSSAFLPARSLAELDPGEYRSERSAVLIRVITA